MERKKNITEFTADERSEFRRLAYEKRKQTENNFMQNARSNIKNYYRGIPQLFKWGWLKAYINKTSPLEAVKLKCLDCSCYQKEEVTKCPVETCPLWKLRPYQK